MHGSVPYSKDEKFQQLRTPKNEPGTHSSTLSPNAPVFVYQPQQRLQLMNPEMQYQQFQPQTPQQQQPLRQPDQQQPQHHHRCQNYGNSHNGYQQHRNSHFEQHHHSHHHHHHHHNNHNAHHHNQQQQQQQQHLHQQHHYHNSQQRIGALANDVQDRLKINNHPGNNRPSSYNSQYNSQVQQQRSNNSYQSQQSRLKYHSYPSTSAASKEVANNDLASSTPDMETVALDYLSSVIQCLNSNPGQYDTVATRFLTIFEGFEDNHVVLSIAMEDIFNESTKNPNFRYMGAKLYHLLHMLNLKKDSLFLTLLKFKLDDFQREVHEYIKQGEHGKVREATLFLAELYMQLRGDDSRIHLLAENIVLSMRQLLGSETPDNMRCICMTLKLAGYDLTNDCPQEIAEIISCLHNINERSPGKYPIIASVLALSKENWGRKLSSSASFSESECQPEPPRSSDEPIFYGPDGRELTTEETDFLTGGLSSVPGGSTDDDDEADLEELDLEMDEEASKAYKEFCKQSATS